MQYLPFRGKLRLSYGKTIGVCSAVLVAWQLGFVWLTAQPFCSLDMMLVYRFAQLALLVGLTCALIRGPLAQSLFVYSLLFPCMMLILAAACFIARFMPARGLTDYMATSLIRLALSAAMLPFMIWLFKRVLIPIMDVQEDGVWRCAWLIPAAFSLVSIPYTDNNFELTGVGMREVAGRAFLFGGVMAACLMLFRMIRQAEMRIRAAEEAKKSKLLLELEAEQYRALADGIQNARKARHDLRQHMSVVSALAEQGDISELKSYVARFTDTVPSESARLVCDNHAASAIIRHYLARAEAAQIAVAAELDIPSDIRVEDTDLAIALGNLLENAIEACDALPPGARSMEIKARALGSRLFIVLSNSCEGETDRSEGGTLSKKRGYKESGVGLMSVRAVVEKYDGDMKLTREGERFSVSVMLRGKRD